jgi:hypothetical protein
MQIGLGAPYPIIDTYLHPGTTRSPKAGSRISGPHCPSCFFLYLILLPSSSSTPLIHSPGTKKPPPSIEAAPGVLSGFAWLLSVSHLPSRTQDGLNRQSLLLDNKQQDQYDDQNQLIGESHHS